MMDLKKKKILFIGTGFFDYDESIKEKLVSYGASVIYLSTAITNLKKRLYIRLGQIDKARAAVSQNLLTLLKQLPESIDYIFVIKADNFQQEHVDFIKRKYSNIPIVLYLWDSVKWLNNRDVILNNFDNIYTFDRLDSEQFNLKFRPLFYRTSSKSHINIMQYDISFVGSWHSGRYEFLRKIIPQLKENGINYRFILRGGGFSIFYDKYITKRIKKEDSDIFITTPISYADYLEICMKSKVILDVANPMQSGLTIRTIEVLGMGKKLLTTNLDIRNYGIDKRLYSVIDINNPIIDVDFIKESAIVESDLRKFSLDSFLEDIFEGFNTI